MAGLPMNTVICRGAAAIHFDYNVPVIYEQYLPIIPSLGLMVTPTLGRLKRCSPTYNPTSFDTEAILTIKLMKPAITI
ncbi:MAG: hypothetical protein IPP46_06050 [Bacteroidetes bacterium]|nr:hypothetical protein [Bacteroidota bacterium]